MTSPPASHDRSRRGTRLRDLKSVPVLPSLITLGNLFLGFLVMAKIADAISLSDARVMSDAVISVFEVATLLIFLAMVFDALDGKVARATGQTSQFGAQLDSMADMVTFGVAPAFLAKALINFHEGDNSLLPTHPKLYYGAAAIYVLCAAMRLARYNVETGGSQSEHREFKGLPTPGAAVMLCSAVTFFCGWELRDGSMKISRSILPEEMSSAVVVAMPATLVCLGLLMVSRVPYPHVFQAMVARRHSFPFLATLVVMLGLLAVEPQLALLFLTLSYVLYGIGLGTYRLVTTGSMDPPDDPGEDLHSEEETASVSRSTFPSEFTKDPKLN
ncbi:MAG: CDP-alcohol phosphatidyltransferase family protein [Planctomycetota bacterium]|jgi:CDP-diacylglycerol--serine O-phosphatidyltransferase